MTDVIDFLERLGQDAALRRASLESAASAGMSTELRVALANRDQRSLEALLRVGNSMLPDQRSHRGGARQRPVRSVTQAA